MKVISLNKLIKRHFNFQLKKGLLGLMEFKSPKTITDYTKNIIDRSKQISIVILNSPKNLKIIEYMDKISNDCCTMIDGSTAIYHLHSNMEFKKSSFESIIDINKFFDELNSNPKLFNILLDLFFSEKVTSGLLFNTEMDVYLKRNIEEILSFHRYCDKNIINQISFSENLENICSELKNVTDFNEIFEISKSNLEGTSSQSLKSLIKIFSERYKSKNLQKENSDKEFFEADLNFCYTIVKKSNIKEVRDQGFIKISKCGNDNTQKVLEILKQRLRYSKSLGYRTFSEYQLQSQSLKLDPKILIDHIKKLWMNLKPNIIFELFYIYKFVKQMNKESGFFSDIILDKANFLRNYEVSNLQSTYIDYMLSKIDEKSISKKYLTIQNLFNGLSLVTKNVFNKDLIPILDEDMIKEDMIEDSILLSYIKNDQNEINAKIYFDLFVRDGKFRDIFSQFSIKGSKQLNMFDRNLKQLPISIIASNFEVTDRNLFNMPIGFNEAKSIFHEFGHTLHSVLSKTDFQALSGNRIPLDYAEIPSHLMEYFLYDYNFCKQWMKDNDSNESIPENIHNILSTQGRYFSNLDLEETLHYSLFDLLIHNNENEEMITEQFLLDTNYLIINEFTVSHQINFTDKFFEEFLEI